MADPIAYLRRRVFALYGETGLPQDDRHELASWVLGRDVVSWREFDERDWWRMVDALGGWHKVEELRLQRSGGES